MNFGESDFNEEGEGESEPRAGRRWIRRMVAVLLSVALIGNILAFWPKTYSIQAMQFLKKSQELSRNPDIQQFKEAIVIVNAGDRKGTGFNIHPEGYIITNHHVIDSDSADASIAPITVSFANGDVFSTEIAASNPAIDIAVLKVRQSKAESSSLEVPTLSLENGKEESSEGDPVYVIGNPLFFNRIANEGNILGMIRLDGWQTPVMVIDAPIYKGNSGSPVLNLEGNVIAVVFATTQITISEKKLKVGLAVPIRDLLPYINL